MSVDKSVYAIYGYDLTQYMNDILTEEFCDSKEYEDLTCNQVVGRIQLFDDPMSGEHLYFGYIIGEIGDDYSDQCFSVDFDKLKSVRDEFVNKAFELLKGKNPPELKIIVFTEFY